MDRRTAPASPPAGTTATLVRRVGRLLALAVALALLAGPASWAVPAGDVPPGASGVGPAPAAAAPSTATQPSAMTPTVLDARLSETVATAADRTAATLEPVGATLDCLSGFALEAVAGCIRHHGDGLSDLQLLDGSTVTVATPHGHGDEGHEDPEHAEGSSSRSTLDNPRRSVACAPRHTHRTVVLYAHRPGQSRMGPAMRGQIREVLERSNWLVARSGRASGGPSADLRFACARNTEVISIPSIEIRGTSFAHLQDAARRAGYTSEREKYLIFADVPSPDRNIAGMAQIHRDDRRTLTNRHNHGAAMYGAVWSGHFDGRTPLHELSHLMGAVQPSAPSADGGFHCTDARDVLCSPTQVRGCGTYQFDCGNNSYFSTAPRGGSYLATHWNLGWAGNRYIDVVGRPTPNVPPQARFEAACTTATCRFDARASTDVDGTIQRVVWRFGDGGKATGWRPTHTFDENGTHTVTVTVVDDRGARDTATRQITVRNQAPTARISVACEEHTCEYDGSGSSDPDGTVTAHRWDVDGQTRTGPRTRMAWPGDGTYTVGLTVVDNDGWASSRTTRTVTVCGTTTLLGEVACDAGGLVDRATGSDLGTQQLEPLREAAGGSTAVADQTTPADTGHSGALQTGRDALDGVSGALRGAP